MSKKLGYTIHRVVRPAKAGGPVAPGLVREFTDKDFDELEGMGAVREPTETELALYERSKPKKRAPVKKTTEADDPAKKAAAEAAKEANDDDDGDDILD